MGVLFCLLVLEGGLRLVSWGYYLDQQRRNRSALDGTDAIRVLCVGESTTAMGGKNSYPAQLEQVLDERSPDRTFRVINGGVGGADTALLVSRLPQQLAEYRPHVVVTMVGANDPFGSRVVDLPRWDQPLPSSSSERAARPAFPYGLKTYRLVEILGFYLTRDRERAVVETYPVGELPADAAEGDHYKHPEAPVWADVGPHHYPFVGMRSAEVRAARKLARDGDLAAAGAALRDTAAEPGNDPRALVEWGAILERSGRHAEARAVFEEVLQRDPARVAAVFGLARLRAAEGDCDGAEELFEEAAQIDFRSGHGYVTAGLCHLESGDADRAEALLVTALKYKRGIGPLLGNPEKAKIYAYRYWVEGRSGGIWDQLAEPVSFNPQDTAGRLFAVDLLEHRGDHDRVDTLAVEVESGNVSAAVALRLAQHFHDRGDEERAARFMHLARGAMGLLTSSMTVSSYEQIQAILDQRGIPLIAVQYATRPVEQLRQMIPWNADVLFVDNEASFREALQQHPYDALFWDHCYGDMGHATRLGNRLLAENVAEAVLEVTDRGTR